MKKKSLLLAISAMSIAAIGVGTVGTFAWFSATAAAGTASAGSALTGTLASEAGTATTSDNFVIGLTNISFDPATIQLTDGDGNTYVDINGTTAGGKQIVSGGNKESHATGVLTVTYSGEYDDADLIKSVWAQTYNKFSYGVTAVNSGNSAKASAAGKTFVTGSGVKLNATSGSAKTEDAVASSPVACTMAGTDFAGTETFTKTGDVWSFTSSKTFGIYVALLGLDDTVQQATDYYEVTFTPTVASV